MSSNVATLDLSEDIATLLRKGTAAAHIDTENTKGAAWLTRGELDKTEYVCFLVMLWHIYTVLEEALELHSLNPILAPTYNPTLLARNPALSSDIAHLLSTSESSWQQHPVALSVFHNLPKPLTDYTARIHAISKSTTPSLLLAHAYVRYLGDLSGGQVIRHNIVKAYNLDTAPGPGTQFYAFKKLGGGGTATQGDMKKIKEWYREGMNTGVGGEENLKVMLVEEANVAFRLNAALLNSLSSLPSTVKKEIVPAVLKDISGSNQDTGLPLLHIVVPILLMSLAHYLFQKFLPIVVSQAQINDQALHTSIN